MHATQHAFVNGLRGLYNIDAHQLPELTPEEWVKFRDNPPLFLIKAAPRCAAAIWRELEKSYRQNGGEVGEQREGVKFTFILREAAQKSGLPYGEIAKILESFRDEIAEAMYFQAAGRL